MWRAPEGWIPDRTRMVRKTRGQGMEVGFARHRNRSIVPASAARIHARTAAVGEANMGVAKIVGVERTIRRSQAEIREAGDDGHL